jgi:pimeloyl-ACP methyl ester carboxylesterase
MVTPLAVRAIEAFLAAGRNRAAEWAQCREDMMATFVLVHGAWAGSLVWRPNAQALRKAGHEVYTPTLTGIGERKHLVSREVDLETHIQDVLGDIDYEDLDDIVLVGHSYGGMVVTGVADRIPGKIASLVYLDAFVPESGQGLFNLIPAEAPRPDRPAIPAAEDYLTPPLPPESFGPVTPEIRAFFERKTSPQPTATFTQPVKLTGGIDRIKRKTYIYCNVPAPTTFTQFYEKLKGKPGWTAHTLPCTHMAQNDMPNELTALLLQAIP